MMPPRMLGVPAYVFADVSVPAAVRVRLLSWPWQVATAATGTRQAAHGKWPLLAQSEGRTCRRPRLVWQQEHRCIADHWVGQQLHGGRCARHAAASAPVGALHECGVDRGVLDDRHHAACQPHPQRPQQQACHAWTGSHSCRRPARCERVSWAHGARRMAHPGQRRAHKHASYLRGAALPDHCYSACAAASAPQASAPQT